MIAEGTYFAMEAGGGRLAGCGGWSNRRTLFGSDAAAGRQDDLPRPGLEAAKIRTFFVHPDFARQGIGSRILEACERAATEAGFTAFEMGATLTGEKLYRERGYSAVERIAAPLSNGAFLPIIRMIKQA